MLRILWMTPTFLSWWPPLRCVWWDAEGNESWTSYRELYESRISTTHEWYVTNSVNDTHSAILIVPLRRVWWDAEEYESRMSYHELYESWMSCHELYQRHLSFYSDSPQCDLHGVTRKNTSHECYITNSLSYECHVTNSMNYTHSPILIAPIVMIVWCDAGRRTVFRRQIRTILPNDVVEFYEWNLIK